MTDRTRDAIELAKVRWAQLHTFDLDDETWERLFTTCYPGDVLQAIRLTQKTRSTDPAVVYARFEEMLARLAAKRSLPF